MEPDRSNCSDEELTSQAQRGSLSAFDELILRYHRRIYAFIAQSCRNPADAAEVTQETFIRAFRGLGTFRTGRFFAGWLFAIARHQCIDHHRAAPHEAAAPLPELVDHDSPSELLVDREERRTLWDVARRVLPETQFQALWLKYAEEMDVATIAQVLGKTRTHVKVLLFRARRVLAEELVTRSGRADIRPLNSSADPAGGPVRGRTSVALAPSK